MRLFRLGVSRLRLVLVPDSFGAPMVSEIDDNEPNADGSAERLSAPVVGSFEGTIAANSGASVRVRIVA